MRLVLCMLLLALVGGCGWKSVFDDTNENNGSGELSPNHYVFFSNTGDPVGGLSSPLALAYDPKGYIYVVDSDHDRIVKYTRGGNYVLQFGSGTLNNPQGVTVDTSGRVYVADAGNNCIRQYSGTGALIDTWNNTGTVAGLKYYNGSVYATVTTAPVHIQQYNLVGSKILDWGGPVAGNATQPAGTLTLPVGVTVLNNFVYVLDQGPKQINKYTTAGVYQESSTAGAFINPVQIDALNGKIYVADADKFCINVYTDITAAPTVITTSQTTTGQDTQAAGVAVDSSGLIYVAERNANRIEVLRQF